LVAKEKRKKEKREKGKGKDDRMLIRSYLTYFSLIFCGPERTEEKMAITRDLWIHPSTLIPAKFMSNYGLTPKSSGSGSPWEWTNP
jgi:hypothetical protein